ncbi:MAG: DUF4231 domain-containing protein [Actinomycetota bacterium]|nr:DUF4231 domain-containing protein [Actinomycetota bacterium]
MSVESAWECQRRWSGLADVKAARLALWRRVNLALVVVGAVCGALVTQDQWLGRAATVVLGIVGAVALAGAAFVQSTYLNADRVRDRVTARAASEATKSAVYQYLVGVPPYADPGRDSVLDTAMEEVEQKAGSLAGAVLLVTPEPRAVPAVSGIANYVTLRAQEQRAYHFDKVAVHLRLGSRWRAAELTATLTAAVLSAVGGALEGTDVSAWVGVATTIAAALAAHLASVQHARIAASYGITVADLDRLLGRFDAATATNAEAADFVAGVEAVLAGQNDSWVTTLAPQA